MLSKLKKVRHKSTCKLQLVSEKDYKSWLKQQSASVSGWLKTTGIKGKKGEIRLLPAQDGSIEFALAVVANQITPFEIAHLPSALPKGRYEISSEHSSEEMSFFTLSWLLGCYQYDRYIDKDEAFKDLAELVCPTRINRSEIEATAEAIALTRDLITTPAADMGPAELAGAAQSLAAEYGANFSVITGKDLAKQNYPCIYAVGKGASKARAPKLIDFTWGDENAPKVTLVGKGVVFDSGGYDIKPSGGMLLMKKDMGGAAHVLGVAKMVMAMNLPVRLRVLIPAVENMISGNAFRPMDILQSRKGLTIEVGNTDAEGRLILADALTEAASEDPDIIIDVATLTGAARVALGTEIPALFSNSNQLAQDILASSNESQDPLWQLPLHQPYKSLLSSNIADMNNISAGGYGGAITAALFLENFVKANNQWAHVDVMAYNTSSRPGRPKGGEAMGVRAIYHMIRERYKK